MNSIQEKIKIQKTDCYNLQSLNNYSFLFIIISIMNDILLLVLLSCIIGLTKNKMTEISSTVWCQLFNN